MNWRRFVRKLSWSSWIMNCRRFVGKLSRSCRNISPATEEDHGEPRGYIIGQSSKGVTKVMNWQFLTGVQYHCKAIWVGWLLIGMRLVRTWDRSPVIQTEDLTDFSLVPPDKMDGLALYGRPPITILFQVINLFTFLEHERQSCYCNRPWRPIMLWDVEAPTFCQT